MSCLSRSWVLKSDENFHKAECFKIVAQDPNDTMVDKYCCLAAFVAKEACEELLGDVRHINFKTVKAHNAIRLLYKIEYKLDVVLHNMAA